MSTITPERETMPAEESLKDRYDAVRRRIDDAARRSGRSGDDVLLVAVTKYASIGQIRELIKLGHVDFGENRVKNLSQHVALVDEFLQRHRELASARRANLPEAVRWHMIGHLQRNKVRKIIGQVRLIHSLDSLRLAEEIHTVASSRLEESQEVLVQVNISGERQKHGIAAAAARHLIEQIGTMYNIAVRGLMCIAPLAEDPEEARPHFQRARELFDDIKKSNACGKRFNILSMGMSDDFEVAIECGANMVRVGSAIFGSPVDPSD